MNKRFSLIALVALAISTVSPSYGAEPVPGDSCTAGEENYFQRTGGNEIPTGHFLVCKSGTWRSILSWDAAAAITKIGNLSCTNNQILKFNGTTWGCATDNGGTLPGLNSAQIWVGNGSNAATAVTMSGDATLSNAGVLTISNNAIGSAEITDGSIANGDLAGSIALSKLALTGTASSSVFLRGDGAWTAVPAASPSGTAGAVQFSNGTAFASDVTKLFWDDTNKRLGIGTNAPGSPVHVLTPLVGTGLTVVAGYNGVPIAQFSRTDTATASISISASGGDPQAQFYIGPTNVFAIGNDSGVFKVSAAGTVGTSDVLSVTSTGTATATTFAGSGALLTNLPAANLTGTLPAISGANLTALNATSLTTGTVAAARLPAFTGDVTKAVGATALTLGTGVVDLTHLSATGTKDSSTFLRGDNTWAAPPAGGSVPAGTSCGLAVRTGTNAMSVCNQTASVASTCQGFNPSSSCPSGYTKSTASMGFDCIYTCAKN